MNYDCGFEKGNNWFRYRTGGILIHDNKMLFVKSAVGDYYYMIGGGVHMGETSETCMVRNWCGCLSRRLRQARLSLSLSKRKSMRFWVREKRYM